MDDVEAAVAEFLQKVDEAGLEKCREAYTASGKPTAPNTTTTNP